MLLMAVTGETIDPSFVAWSTGARSGARDHPPQAQEVVIIKHGQRVDGAHRACTRKRREDADGAAGALP